jgi:hypothetical protein
MSLPIAEISPLFIALKMTSKSEKKPLSRTPCARFPPF